MYFESLFVLLLLFDQHKVRNHKQGSITRTLLCVENDKILRQVSEESAMNGCRSAADKPSTVVAPFSARQVEAPLSCRNTSHHHLGTNSSFLRPLSLASRLIIPQLLGICDIFLGTVLCGFCRDFPVQERCTTFNTLYCFWGSLHLQVCRMRFCV